MQCCPSLPFVNDKQYVLALLHDHIGDGNCGYVLLNQMEMINLLQTTLLNPSIVSAKSGHRATIH